MRAHCSGFAGVNVSKKHVLHPWLMKGEMQDLFTPEFILLVLA